MLGLADRLRSGAPPPPHPGRAVALLFLSSSLRTRVGFAVATTRLGAQPIDAGTLRWSGGMSAAESFGDTIRTLSGMVDVVVCRTSARLDRRELDERCAVPLISGGDAAAHPSQGLIDLFALRSLGRPLSELHVLICGDLGSRVVRSLLDVLERFPPARLTLAAPPGRDDPGPFGASLTGRLVRRSEFDPTGADVVYLAGLPAGDPGSASYLDQHTRHSYALTAERLALLGSGAVVLSPLPLVDELAEDVRADRRCQAFDQSDDGVFVRAALLDFFLSSARR